MACCSFKPLQSREQFSVHLCKCRSIFISSNFHSSHHSSALILPTNTHLSSSSLVAKSLVNPNIRCFASSCSNSSNGPISFRSAGKIGYGVSPSRLNHIRAERKFVQNSGRTSVADEENIGQRLRNKEPNDSRTRLDNSGKRSQKGSGFRSKDVYLSGKYGNKKHDEVVNGKVVQKPVRNGDCSDVIKGQKQGKSSKKSKSDPAEVQFRTKLDMCSKKGDVMGAISLYDSTSKEGLKLGQYHYTVLLYLCSSAAMGVIRPAKSGSGSRSLDMVAPSREAELKKTDGAIENMSFHYDKYLSSNKSLDGVKRAGDIAGNVVVVDDDGDDDDEGEEEEEEEEENDIKDRSSVQEMVEVWVSEDVKKYALERGFEIYEKMHLEGIPMNEAALTSVARMAMAMGNGDMAFDMVKQMKAQGINPRLRSYGPALSAFCSSKELEKAIEVEKHMLENGVHPEEAELEALLRVSVEVGKADMVYYLLHKLRTAVRSVSSCTADLIEKWFKSIEASRVGKRKWDPNAMLRVTENVGGGWHGQGWLGRGKWTVARTSIADDGSCRCCGAKLTLIDLDPEETEKFAESVASIAAKREKNSSFQKFQKWLSYYGPYEAVVDAANVGLYSQRKFKPSKVNAVVNGIRQMLPSKTWPLIILHNRRVTGSDMDKHVNKALVEKWRNADALYATPTGSNDDWYWLYAAIKLKCLLVTNDEMRDHTFQLLGNDFFPKWKERHQVRFSFSEVGPVFHMPPPCSVVIQESEIGHWHIPIVSEHQSEGERTWLCITRSTNLSKQDPMSSSDDDEDFEANKESASPDPDEQAHSSLRNLRNIVLASEPAPVNNQSIRKDIEAAEKLGSCVVDFQI